MIHNLLRGKKIILASASPRRMEIFKLVGIKAIQMPSHIEEEMIYDNPIKLVKFHAQNKARAIKKQFEIPVETNEITKFSTPLEIVNLVEKKKQ